MAFRDYSINIEKQINRLVPYYMRGRKMLLFLHAICSPLSFFNDEEEGFNPWSHQKLQELSMTAQKPRLEWYLNNVIAESLDITLTGSIKIYDETTSPAVLYMKSELRDRTTAPLFYPNTIPTVTRLKSNSSDKKLANVLVRKTSEVGSIAGKFTISVPYSGSGKEEVTRKISSAISRFIPVGITFRITYI